MGIWETYDSIEEFLEDYDPRDEWPEVLEHFDIELEPEPEIIDDIAEDGASSDEWAPGEEFDIEFWEEVADEDYPEHGFEVFEDDSP